MKKNLTAIFGLVFIVMLLSIQLAMAIEFNQTLSSQDKATFDQMLSPVMKIYNLVKYSATVLAVLVLLFAGVMYITSGSDPGKREQAKNMAMYVIIGLVVIWAAPLIVNFIVG
jgi:type IV secretory pathway VirB2 component (pilin)